MTTSGHILLPMGAAQAADLVPLVAAAERDPAGPAALRGAALVRAVARELVAERVALAAERVVLAAPAAS